MKIDSIAPQVNMQRSISTAAVTSFHEKV